MASSSGTEEELQGVMDQRKRKRMVSNRESARRSRMRKQKHVEDLGSQVTELTNQKHEILSSLNSTTQQLLEVEAENSVLRAQMSELSHRLDSLNEIIHFLNASNGIGIGGPFIQPMTMSMNMNHPIMASPHILQY